MNLDQLRQSYSGQQLQEDADKSKPEVSSGAAPGNVAAAIRNWEKSSRSDGSNAKPLASSTSDGLGRRVARNSTPIKPFILPMPQSRQSVDLGGVLSNVNSQSAVNRNPINNVQARNALVTSKIKSLMSNIEKGNAENSTNSEQARTVTSDRGETLAVSNLVQKFNQTLKFSPDRGLSSRTSQTEVEVGLATNDSDDADELPTNDFLLDFVVSDDADADDVESFDDDDDHDIIPFYTRKFNDVRVHLHSDDEYDDVDYEEVPLETFLNISGINSEKSQNNLSSGDDSGFSASTEENNVQSKSSTVSSINCPICMDSLAEINENGKHLCASSLCGHAFCNKCLETILVTQPECPTCRKKLNRRQIFKLFL